jgi:hypothetical protein
MPEIAPPKNSNQIRDGHPSFVSTYTNLRERAPACATADRSPSYVFNGAMFWLTCACVSRLRASYWKLSVRFSGRPAGPSGQARGQAPARPRALNRPLLFPARPPIRLALPPALQIAASTCFTKGRERVSAGPPRLRARPPWMRRSSGASRAIPKRFVG